MAHGVHEELLENQVQLKLDFVIERIFTAKAGDLGGQPLKLIQTAIQ
jgi:hypothetical protein